MENKTISYLNSKMWYRFIKVFFLLFLFLCLVSSSIAIFTYYSPKYDNDKSYIKCANGKNFILSQNGINLYSDFMWDFDTEKAKSFCFDGNLDFKTDKYGRTSLSTRLGITSETNNSGKYELVGIYTSRNWIATIGFILLPIVISLFIFEATRRGFYYIVLGSIRPKK